MNSKEINPENIGKAVSEARKLAGLSQVYVSGLIGVNKRTLCAYEKGRRRIPSPHLLKLAKILNLSIDSLLEQDFPKIDGRTRSAHAIRELDKLPEEDQKFVFGMIDKLTAAAK